MKRLGVFFCLTIKSALVIITSKQPVKCSALASTISLKFKLRSLPLFKKITMILTAYGTETEQVI